MTAPAYIRVPCAKVYAASDPRVLPVELVVMHWTGSPPQYPDDANEERMRAWLADNDRKTSTHLVIMRDGRVLEAADITKRTWHAGGSTWIDPRGKLVRGINQRSIGVDLENVGYLRRNPEGDGFIDGYGGRYKGAQPIKAGGAWFEPYAPAQIEALGWVVRDLSVRVLALRDPARWVGHSDIQPGKPDPGPLFPWSVVRGVVAQAARL